jgi:hypothetical protein
VRYFDWGERADRCCFHLSYALAAECNAWAAGSVCWEKG